MPMATVYIETSIISYAAARLSIDPHTRVRQEEARRWWQQFASKFDLFVSQTVLEEASRGNADAAIARMKLLDGLPLIPLSDEVIEGLKSY